MPGRRIIGCGAPWQRGLLALASCALGGASASAQTIEDLRDNLRERLRGSEAAATFTTLVVVADDVEWGVQLFDLKDAESTEIATLSIPFRRSFLIGDEDDPRLYFESSVGYARAREQTADLFGGSAPALRTSADSITTTAGVLVGLGPEFRPHPELTLTPIINFGVSYLQNETDYAGPGAEFTAAVADGIAFNWEAWAISTGVAGRANWVKPLPLDLVLDVVARYDVRGAETIAEDDPAQEFDGSTQFLTLRGDLIGFTGLEVLGGPLKWRATVGHRRFLQGNLYGVTEYTSVGGGFEIPGLVPAADRVTLTAGYLFGQDVDGFTFGLGVSF